MLAISRLSPASDEGGSGRKRVPLHSLNPTEREDLPYKVEVWDDAKESVEQIVAITASAAIGYAAYYAATKEFPLRYITLRFKNRVVTRWNGPAH